MSHVEPAPQDVGRDEGQANQHRAVEIVVGHVVSIGSHCEQFGSVANLPQSDQCETKSRIAFKNISG